MINAPFDRAIHWQTRPLCCRYLWVQFEALQVKVQDAGVAHDRVVHWAFGVLADGEYEVLGAWLAPALGPMRWTEVFEDLTMRGVEKIRFIASSDPNLVHAAYPDVVALPSMERLLRQSLEQVAPRDGASAAEALGAIRDAGTAEAAHAALAGLANGPLGATYPALATHWRDALAQLGPFYALASRLRRVIRSGDAAFWAFHRGVSVETHKHACFVDGEAGAAFVAGSLNRAERLGQRRLHLGARAVHRAVVVTRRSHVSAVRL